MVLTRDEVARVLACMTGTPRTVALLLYGAGLRLLECLQLRVKDIDFGANLLRVRSGKGNRDRVALLPVVARERCRGSRARPDEAGRSPCVRHPPDALIVPGHTARSTSLQPRSSAIRIASTPQTTHTSQ
jgi:integrase